MRTWPPFVVIGLFLLVQPTATADSGTCATKGDGNNDCRLEAMSFFTARNRISLT